MEVCDQIAFGLAGSFPLTANWVLFFAKLAEYDGGEQQPPDVMEADEADLSYDSDDFLKVAGDGACPAGQDDVRTRRAGCGLWYGEKHNHIPHVRLKAAPREHKAQR